MGSIMKILGIIGFGGQFKKKIQTETALRLNIYISDYCFSQIPTVLEHDKSLKPN